MSTSPTAADISPHRPADDSEEIYFEGSPSLRGHVWRLVGWGLIAVALGGGGIGVMAMSGAWIFGLILIIIAAVVVFVPILLTRSVRYRISNYRIDFERGLLSRTIDTLELWHVDDIQFHQSLSDRVLGVGTISVLSDDHTTPNLIIRGLPRPRPIFESLKQRVIAVKRQRGVIKMDIG